MLYIVLGLVLAALGLLIATLTTANTLWAWLSVVVSIAAAAALISDWLRNRIARERAEQAAARQTARHPTASVKRTTRAGAQRERAAEVTIATPAIQQPIAAEATAVVAGVPADTDDLGDPADEPPEEATDATDLLIVSGLYAEVRVVDERPRYHLGKCAWLAGRETLGLPISEARQLGFTPCALCGPDAVLARRHREGPESPVSGNRR